MQYRNGIHDMARIHQMARLNEQKLKALRMLNASETKQEQDKYWSELKVIDMQMKATMA